ncbi:unnamed protein product [Rotaria sordida]|uniref:LamG-like jellyroll fold domain-containing protein n=1 Tax=Rotaria sordida TaxID=392033 RepID=A0A819L380_9BILA|nr:unnamed protein product [Rotaria sordida]CAF3954734.1 unnamed protein product [Rotaria sordida]
MSTTTVTTTTVTTPTNTTVTTTTTNTTVTATTENTTVTATNTNTTVTATTANTTVTTTTNTTVTATTANTTVTITTTAISETRMDDAVSATDPSTLPVNVWTHVAQTFSSTSGSRLYIDGVLITIASAPTGTPVGPYVFIGASPAGSSPCNAGLIATGQFYGSVDEFRVFGRELTTTDICRLADP